MSLVFDHSKDTLSDAMGMQDNQVEELSEKLGKLTKHFLLTQEETKSELAEKIAEGAGLPSGSLIELLANSRLLLKKIGYPL